MEPTNDGIDEGEEQGLHSRENDEGSQESEKVHDSRDREQRSDKETVSSSDGEQGSDEEIVSSSDGDDSSEHVQPASVSDIDDDVFDAAGGITFFHLFHLHVCKCIFGIGY